ncbi:MAG: hypothetical protein J6K29_12545 [Clostridia bacterium]|nr:hypothetical protein [Clostridia bacterium]
MKPTPFALKSPFWLHGFLYVLAAHLAAYLIATLAFVILPEDLVHLSYLFALGSCILSLPLFFWWFFRNENPISYPAAAAVSQIACGLAGVLMIFPMIALADALISDPDKLNPWAFLAIWAAVALFFGALLLVLCLGLFIYALIRRKLSPTSETIPEAASAPLPETTSDT